ncbi:hypothetical protein [Lutimonas sp.]|uniref:hypothetical protein n=1 Tax=Lutimonas sp. TaxID=1872403 RepID=UPI003D9B6399
MTDKQKIELIKESWNMHAQVEAAYLDHSSKKGESDWLEKQRLLLADMALHLLQTCMKPDVIELEKLKNNLHAILTISDQFIPYADLIKATDRIYND